MRALLTILLCWSSLASAEDKTVVLYTSLAPTESGPLGKAFEKKTGIKVEIWRALSEKVVQRALSEQQAKRYSVDVVESNDPEMEMLAREKIFAVRKGLVLFAELIAAGEIPVGLTAYNANAESLKRRGAPIDWVPVQPVVARPQGIGIARNAPHPEAAVAFVHFVLSPEGQELLNSMGRVPVSTRVRTHMNQFDYTLVDSATVLDEQDRWLKEWDRLFVQK